MSENKSDFRDETTTIAIWKSTKDLVDEEIKRNEKETYREVFERIVRHHLDRKDGG